MVSVLAVLPRTAPRRWPRRVARAGAVLVTSVIALILAALVLAECVLPASAITFPVRVVDAGARVSPTGPDVSRYPYRTTQGRIALDPDGFVVGQCTSFVAWWLGAHHLPLAVITVGPGGTGSFLNASTWDRAATSAGFAVGTVPVVGAIAQWHAEERTLSQTADGAPRTFVAGETGHVAVVTRVLPDGEAEWAEYGWRSKPVLHVGRGWAPRYLYLGVSPPSAD